LGQLQNNDIDLYYEVHGPAASASPHRPLLLVAGLASDSQSWLPVLETLACERPVIIFDNRGCGRTRAQPGADGISRLADDCLRLAEHLALERFDLLGHSMGGFIALECARRAPDRVARLLLCNSSAAQSARNQLLFSDWADEFDAGQAEERWFRTFFYWILTPAFFDDAPAVEQLLELAIGYPHRQTAAGFRGQVVAMRGFDARPWLETLTMPTLVLASAEDQLYPPGADGSGLAALPNAQLVSVANGAHSLPLESPAQFSAAVLEFLAQPD
jgi:pimeloyl-ACP methyl ester carboxylesterase